MSTFCTLCLLLSGFAAEFSEADIADQLDSARSHRQHGRYEEAAELYDELIDAKAESAELALDRADLALCTGGWEQAQEILSAGAKQFPEHVRLSSKLAEWLWQRGKWDECQRQLDVILKDHPDEPLARLVQARLWTDQGDLKEAEKGYRWFVGFYNKTQPTDAETLLMVAEGSLQYTRWKGGKQNFDFVLNTLCADALKSNPDSWQSYWLSGGLLLEKYNRAQGVPELQKGLAINPVSAELLTAMGYASAQDFEWDEAREFADKALNVNPHSPAALRLSAETLIHEGDLAAAQIALDRALQINPWDQETLAIQAMVFLQQDGKPDLDRIQAILKSLRKIDQYQVSEPKRWERLVIDLARRNPRPGYFLAKLASQLASVRRHDVAEVLYLAAIDTMPQLAAPKNELGLLYMQVGKTAEATQLLDAAFKADPFHVRVSNMRKVLKVLDEYQPVTTEHFVIRADSELDHVLARYMAEYLEEIYPELTQQFGYEPPARTQIEVYNKSKGRSAHQWFSARMIGLPWIQTIGASTGVIIAMASPTGLDEPLNWARVLKHEFVHVITLQQTQFHIPHWYTEALAVRAEGYSRPAEWNKLLLERVPQGRLRNLDNLNLGFQRAENRDDWNFSYCLSSLYAQHMTERFGPEAPAKLLDAYRRQLPTDEAIQDAFGVSQSDFERTYREFLSKLVSGLQAIESEPQMTPAEIMAAYEADASDPVAAGRYAQLLILRKNYEQAKEVAAGVLESHPEEPHAAMAMAALHLAAEDKPAAVKVLIPALDREHPHRRLLERLASFQVDLGDIDAAEENYDLGREKFPNDPVFWQGTAITARALKKTDKLKSALETLCDIDYDRAAWPLERAELGLADGDLALAKLYGIKALHVDVLDTKIHSVLGKSHLGLGDAERGAAEFRVALELQPGDAALQLGLAECYLALQRQEEAKDLITAVLNQEPDHAAAKELLQKLKP